MNFANDTGSVNALVVALVPALQAYTVGLPLRVRVLHDNLVDATHTSMTLDAGAGPAPIRKMDGSSPANAEIRAGALIEVAWDGTAWQLVNFGGAGSAGTVNYLNVNIPYVVDTGTVNNIVGPFSPAITVLNVGAVLLVKILNSVTDITTLKVNALAPHPVKAPDGSDLLPGDIVAGDVVEFVFDGTNFYIRPNPAISVNSTINVPTTRFPTVASVLSAVSRKMINPGVTLTIQLAVGVFPPIGVYHMNSDRIVIKGTMLTSAPTNGNFSQTGSLLADSANNIAMLRTRYGTEINFTWAAHYNLFILGYACGVANLGPGSPTFQDLLVTGDNINQGAGAVGGQVSSTTGYRTPCVFAYMKGLTVKNVATWGGSHGFLTISGNIDIQTTAFACGHWSCGVQVSTGGVVRSTGTLISVGNHSTGVFVTGHSIFMQVPPQAPGLVGVAPSQCNYNGGYGLFANAVSELAFYGGVALGNGNSDIVAGDNTSVWVYNTSFNNSSPVYNTIGNAGAAVYWGAGPPGMDPC